MKRTHLIESDFEYKGMRCIVVLQSMGHRCGYVGITEHNALYGKDYSTTLCFKNDDSCHTVECHGEPRRIDDCFNVHGGITYSAGGNGSIYPVESDLWWFGFDCAHYNDAKDYETAFAAFADDNEIIGSLMIAREIDSKYPPLHCKTVRTREYVEAECMNLANQLAEYEVGRNET